jgi:hypothetical protein
MRRESACAERHLVDRHFDLRIRPAEERSLREHLAGCAACRDRYARHLALSALDPRAPNSRDRLAVGLGLRRRRARVGPILAAAAACATIASVVALRYRNTDDLTFAERGEATSRLFVYRVRPGEAPSIAGHQIAGADELAFAYENGRRRKYLLVFAVDEHRHIYWYHPAWTDERATALATVISTAPGVHELPEAIGHSYDGSTLVLHAVFTNQALSVRDMEERMSHLEPGDPIAEIPAEDQQRISLGVTP